MHQNAGFCICNFKILPAYTPEIPLQEGQPPPAPSPSTAYSRTRGCVPIAVTYIRSGAYITCSAAPAWKSSKLTGIKFRPGNLLEIYSLLEIFWLSSCVSC